MLRDAGSWRRPAAPAAAGGGCGPRAGPVGRRVETLHGAYAGAPLAGRRACWRIGALGTEAARLRGLTGLPTEVLRVLPAIRDTNGTLAAVPALDYPSPEACRPFATLFIRAA